MHVYYTPSTYSQGVGPTFNYYYIFLVVLNQAVCEGVTVAHTHRANLNRNVFLFFSKQKPRLASRSLLVLLELSALSLPQHFYFLMKPFV